MAQPPLLNADRAHHVLKVERVALLKGRAMLESPAIHVGPPLRSQTGQDVSALAALSRQGSIAAATELGVRFVAGIGMPIDIDKAERLLRSSANVGDPLAMLVLGQWVRSGRLATASLWEAREWFVRCGAVDVAEEPMLGSKLYRLAWARASGDVRALLLCEAAALLFAGFLRGQPTAAASLAYMIRRREVSRDTFPDVDRLLQRGLKIRHPFAIVNQALALAERGEWRAADPLFGTLPGSHGVLEWWARLLAQPDPEANLVIGWLVRYGLAVDPDRWSLRSRFAAATSVWPVPEWMLEPCRSA